MKCFVYVLFFKTNCFAWVLDQVFEKSKTDKIHKGIVKVLLFLQYITRDTKKNVKMEILMISIIYL